MVIIGEIFDYLITVEVKIPSRDIPNDSVFRTVIFISIYVKLMEIRKTFLIIIY